MVHAFDIRTVQKMLLFVNVIEDGLDGIVTFHIRASVRRIHYISVFRRIIDPYVPVPYINLVHDVFFSIQLCQVNDNFTCVNGGRCVPNDEFRGFDQKFICICPIGFSGDRCELSPNILMLSFAKNIALSQSIFIHFIKIRPWMSLRRVTFFKTILARQDSIIVKWSEPFHLGFVELLLPKTYYLVLVQKTYNLIGNHR